MKQGSTVGKIDDPRTGVQVIRGAAAGDLIGKILILAGISGQAVAGQVFRTDLFSGLNQRVASGNDDMRADKSQE